MDCVVEDLKELNKSLARDALDVADIRALIKKMIKHKCCNDCQLRAHKRIMRGDTVKLKRVGGKYINVFT